MFGAEYEQVDIMLGAGAGQVKLIGSIKRERRQANSGTNWTPQRRSSFYHRWRTLRKYYVPVRRRLEDFLMIFGSMLGESMELVETTSR